MGGAFTSLSNDISCLYWNPSGIARLDSHGAFLHIEWLADISYDFVGFTIPFDASTIGLSAIFLTMDEMKYADMVMRIRVKLSRQVAMH